MLFLKSTVVCSQVGGCCERALSSRHTMAQEMETRKEHSGDMARLAETSTVVCVLQRVDAAQSLDAVQDVLREASLSVIESCRSGGELLRLWPVQGFKCADPTLLQQ